MNRPNASAQIGLSVNRARRRHHRTGALPAAPARGLTLVELLVALVLSLLVTIAALAALLIARQGYSTVDASSVLRDNARFGTDMLTRVTMQAGYQNFADDSISRAGAVLSGVDPQPDVAGFNNAILAEDPLTTLNGSRTTGCGAIADTSCVNGSDILIVRFQGSSIGGAADNSIINCLGIGEPAQDLPVGVDDRATSIFHVDRDDGGEPALMCTYLDRTNPAAPVWSEPRVLLSGVESFQVLFGTEGVTPNTPPDPGAVLDTVPDRFLRADEIAVPGDPVATRANWRRVRSVRIGLVLRGAPGSASDPESSELALRPLGSYAQTDPDPGALFEPARDNRLRIPVTFTVHLRNDISLRQ